MEKINYLVSNLNKLFFEYKKEETVTFKKPDGYKNIYSSSIKMFK